MKPEHKSVSTHKILFQKLAEVDTVKKVEKSIEILKEGQFVKLISFVQEGLIKVFTRYEERELLFYYIQPNQSCIISFAASTNNEHSRFFQKFLNFNELGRQF